MIFFTFLVLVSIVIIQAGHFNGGSITWMPVNPDTNGSTVVITILQSYSWTLSSVTCDKDVPISTSGRSNENRNLTCVAGCSNQGNYSNGLVDILTDCISSSPSLDLMKSQRAKNVTLTIGANFTVAYRDGNWRSLENGGGSKDWSITCLINLQRRPDGIINTPPVSTVVSPQYVIVNQMSQIKIPVSDVNDGDDVRCRWAQQSGLSSVDECDSVCYTNNLPSGTNLSNCVLSFEGTSQGKWYAITLQIEDFISTTSTTPMSSVPVQFLIYVLPTPQCSVLPTILPLTSCLNVQVGTPINYTLFAMNTCDKSKTIITDISVSMPIDGMNTSDVYNSTTNTSLSYITLTWTPQSSQLGSQQLCTIAYTNEKVQSEEYCVTFIVETISSFCRTTTTSTTSTTSQTTTTTTQTTSTTTSTTSSTTSRTSTTTTETTTSSTTTTSQTTTTTTQTTSTTTSTTSSTTSTSTTSRTTTTTSTTVTTTTTSKTTTTTTQTTTTTTTSSTTSTSTSTSTSTTSTATTTTSVTTTTVTSTTATTQTTTTTQGVPSKINIPLLIGLSLLALLLSLCCCCCWWWWYYYWSAKGRRRQQYGNQAKLKPQKLPFINRKNRSTHGKITFIQNESNTSDAFSTALYHDSIERPSIVTRNSHKQRKPRVIKVSLVERRSSNKSSQMNLITDPPKAVNNQITNSKNTSDIDNQRKQSGRFSAVTVKTTKKHIQSLPNVV